MKISLDCRDNLHIELPKGRNLYLSYKDLAELYDTRTTDVPDDGYELSVYERNCVHRGKKIAAIKSLRERTGHNLAQAKSLVDIYKLHWEQRDVDEDME